MLLPGQRHDPLAVAYLEGAEEQEVHDAIVTLVTSERKTPAISAVLADRRTVLGMEHKVFPAIRVECPPAGRWASLCDTRVSEGARERLLYAAAGVSYVAVGVFVNEFALSWIVGFSWLMLWVWGLPALVRRLRR